MMFVIVTREGCLCLTRYILQFVLQFLIHAQVEQMLFKLLISQAELVHPLNSFSIERLDDQIAQSC